MRADGKPFPQPGATAKLWVPVPGGPGFLLGPNFYAVRSYNPSMNYALAIVHLGDRIMGGDPWSQPNSPAASARRRWPRSRKSSAGSPQLGFDTGGTDGRVGNGTMRAVRELPAQDPDGSRPTAMPACDCWRGCARRADPVLWGPAPPVNPRIVP